MRRREAKQLNASVSDKNQKAHEAVDSDPVHCDLTLDDLDFLVGNNWYHYKHIAGVAKSLFKKHGLSFGQHFEVVGSSEQLKECLKKHKYTASTTELQNPLFIIYCIGKNHWVAFCIIYSQNGVVALYKDSLGGEIPKEVKKELTGCYSGAIVESHVGKEQEDGHSCGPMALRNVEIILELLKSRETVAISDSKKMLIAVKERKSSSGSKETTSVKKGSISRYDEGLVSDSNEELIADFKRTLFCSMKSLKSAKEKFKVDVGKDILETCIELTTAIAGDVKFKQEIGKLIESCANCIGVLADVETYAKVLRDETEKQENNCDYKVDLDVINATKGTIMAQSDVKMWQEQSLKIIRDSEKSAQKTDVENKDRVAAKSELEKNYPEQLKQFTKVFTLLGGDIHDISEVREEGVREVSKILGFDYKKIKKFYKIHDLESREKISKEIEDEGTVEPVSIDEISRKLSEIVVKQALSVDLNVKPLDQILAELALGNKVEAFNKDVYESDQEIIELESNYRKVKEFSEQWKKKDAVSIKAWASQHKGNLSPDDLFESVAVMDRANELVTDGKLLRDSQILATLAFLKASESQGRLCQIETGEGKTVIVSVLAAIKVLQGKQVDVITSNGVLAEEGVKNREIFFGLLRISVAHNNPDETYKRGRRKCYTADVVYGSMGSFQFDYLKDSFEGLETRGKRRFDFVILDEVDSLLLDNGGHIAKLAEPFPGFDSLKYVYIKIWQELVKAENELAREFEDGLKRKADELKSNENSLTEMELKRKYVDCRSELLANQDDKIFDRIKKSDPAKIDLIPVHLKQFAQDMVDVWIKNAVYAKYFCHENEQYVVRQLQDNEEPKIVPVDYQSTGVTLKNTMWSNGLHQFVQLKHNLQLTSETLTSSLISNIGYVKLYKSNIFGLTGTLGSKAEQQLLSSVYKLGYSNIPTFKPKKFKEICGKIVEDDKFQESIVQDSIKLINDKRSVLIICNTINDAIGLKESLNYEKLHKGLLKISTYLDEDSSDILGKEIDVCEVIIATNIAGRGSDFKTSSALEENGGLHVLVCFLPVNQRVEDQAFGRTARQGKAGTAQIVMRESDALALGFAEGQVLQFDAIKEQRDNFETSRLENIRKVQLAEIDFHDRVFSLFSNLYRQIMKAEEEQPSLQYVLKDLKEFWAFWLHKKQKSTVPVGDVNEEFEAFKHEARHILGASKEGVFPGGNITHNPYYSIQQAEHFLQNNLLARAEESLTHAIKISSKNADLLYSAYIKMFEVAIEQGQSIIGRFFVVLDRVVPFDCKLKTDGKDDYKKKAKNALEKAKKALEKEIKYIERNFTGGSNNDSQSNGTDNDDFLNIILDINSNNLLAYHLMSRLTVLQTFLQHVVSLIAEIATSISGNGAVALTSAVPNFWNSNNLTPEQRILRTQMGDDEFREFGLNGLGTMYAIQVFLPNFDLEPFQPGLIQIGIGLAALSTGALFPPSMPVMAKIAEVFICEGIADIVTVIIAGESKFDIKSKIISYGAQAITIGIFAVLKYTKIAQKAINLCRRLIVYLERSPALRRVAAVLVPVLEKVIFVLEKQIAAAVKVNTTLKVALRKIAIGAAKKGVLVVVKIKVVEKAIDQVLEITLLPKVVENVTIDIRQKNITIFRSVNRKDVLERAKAKLEEISIVKFKDIFWGIVENVANSYDVYKTVKDHINECVEIAIKYTYEVCSDLERMTDLLASGDREYVINDDDEVERIIVELGDLVAKHIVKQIKKKSVKFAMTQINRGVKEILK